MTTNKANNEQILNRIKRLENEVFHINEFKQLPIGEEITEAEENGQKTKKTNRGKKSN